MRPSRMPMSAFTMPQWSMIRALVITRSSAPCCARGAGALAHAVADDFAAAERDLVAVDGEVVLDFDDQFGIGQPDAIAVGGSVQIGVGAASESRGSFAFLLPLWPSIGRSPANSTSGLLFLRPARSGSPSRRECSAACRAPLRGRNRAHRSLRRNDSGCPPARGDRRCFSLPPARSSRPTLHRSRSVSRKYSPGFIGISY